MERRNDCWSYPILSVILASSEVITCPKGVKLYGNKILRWRSGPNRSREIITK
jgi:hypothetical protein